MVVSSDALSTEDRSLLRIHAKNAGCDTRSTGVGAERSSCLFKPPKGFGIPKSIAQGDDQEWSEAHGLDGIELWQLVTQGKTRENPIMGSLDKEEVEEMRKLTHCFQNALNELITFIISKFTQRLAQEVSELTVDHLNFDEVVLKCPSTARGRVDAFVAQCQQVVKDSLTPEYADLLMSLVHFDAYLAVPLELRKQVYEVHLKRRWEGQAFKRIQVATKGISRYVSESEYADLGRHFQNELSGALGELCFDWMEGP